jgi:hypothetical protein
VPPRRSVGDGGRDIASLKGKPVTVTLICPGLDGDVDPADKDASKHDPHSFTAKAKFGDALALDPDTTFKCAKCGRTDGFESRIEVLPT